MNLSIDVHAHLDHPLIGERIPEMLEKAKAAGVHRVITNGLDKRTNRLTLEIAKAYPMALPALGIYPPDALRKEARQAVMDGRMDKAELPNHEFDIEEELDFIRKHLSGITAVGEIGLDFKEGEDRKEQEHVFRSLVEMAMKKGKPVIVHSRKAEAEVVDILSGYGCKKVIMHCFSGKKKLVLKGIDEGFSFSIPTSVVRSQQFQELAKAVPFTKLFCETDAPFLSPFKDSWNEPAFVVESYKKVAELKGTTLEETTGAIFMNYKNMFG